MIGKGPKISMHFREKFGSTTFTKGNNPGPGAYTPEDQPGRAGTAKVRGFGFGSAARLPKEKHSENPGPGTFFFLLKKIFLFSHQNFKKKQVTTVYQIAQERLRTVYGQACVFVVL